MTLKNLFRIIVCCGLLIPTTSTAQSNLFETVISVNGSSISNYEIDQRIRLYRAFGILGDLRFIAENALIDERIYLQAFASAGASVSNRDIFEGASQYASGQNQSLNDFLSRLRNFGVDKESFFEFVRAGIAWQNLVDARFSARAQRLGMDEVDERLELEFKQTTRSVNLLEVGIPIDPNNPDQSRLIAQEIINSISNANEFSQVARIYSAVNSGQRGGALGWINYEELNEPVLRLVEATAPGRVTDTLEINNVIYVFFVANKRERTEGSEPQLTEFATVLIPASNTELSSTIIAESNNCKDFEQASAVLPEGSFQKTAVTSEESLGEFEAVINTLDKNEITQTVNGNGQAVLLMLCQRVYAVDSELRSRILASLQQQQLDLLADSYLENLKASAIVKRN